MKHCCLGLLLLLLLAGCQVEEGKLPILGEIDVVNGDTIYHTVPDFAFVNQDSQQVTNADFEGRAYVVDFFFTSCPTICPKVKREMLRLYDRYKDDDRISLLSHSIDVRRDTVGRLREYAAGMGVSTPKWHFVTGDKSAIYDIADDYFSVAIEDPEAPGGFDHSGRLILVDANRHVRAFCDGTDPASVDQFMKDIDRLLKEN
jgi:protein SCO1